MKYDIAIIGGGPAGYTAAERAAAGGLKTVIFEKKAMGGVCLNEGCIPTKTLLYSAKLLDNAKGAAKYGIAVPDGISFNLEKIIDRKDKVVKKLTGGVKQTVKSYGAELIEKEAVITGEDNGLIQILAGGEKYEVTYLLVCTGSDTVIPPIKGLSEIDYWTSKEALEMAALPKSLAIIGGGVIGMEFASFFNSMGVKVSVIEMMPEILGAMDKETSAMLRTEYQKRGINFQLNSKVIEVSPAGVTIEKAGKLSLIEADKVLVSVGRKANLNQVGLDKLKVEMVRNGVKVDEHMLTSHPKVYACGDITGYSMLAHTAIRESEVAINHILGVEDRMNYHCVPGVVYTNPELAGVGKTEEELKASVLDTTAVKWAKKAMWAPSVIRKNGKYYIFFGANDVHEGEIGGIGVAVSDRPEGPYKDLLGKPFLMSIPKLIFPVEQHSMYPLNLHYFYCNR